MGIFQFVFLFFFTGFSYTEGSLSPLLGCKDLRRIILPHPLSVRPLNELVDKVNKLELKFSFGPHLENENITDLNSKKVFLGSYEIKVLQNNEEVGSIVITKSSDLTKKDIFYSNIGIRKELRDQGVGAMLYCLAARVTFRLGGILYSTDSPSGKAQAAWGRLMSAGWAKRVKDPEPHSPDDEVFTFRQDLLQEGYFDALDKYLLEFESVRGLKPQPRARPQL